MSDNIFYASMGVIFSQIIILTVFYFVAYRRLFLTPGGNNVLPIVLLLVFFKVAYPITFVAGWIRCGSQRLVRVMTFWTLAMTLMIGCCVVLISMEQEPSDPLPLIVSGVVALIMLCLCIVGLRKDLKIDSRLHAAMSEPTQKNLSRVAELGPAIIPHLERILDYSYAPARLTAVKCLRQFGNNAEATFSLQVATSDEEPSVSQEAADALAAIQPLAAPA